MKSGKYLFPVILAAMLSLSVACQKAATGSKPSIVVTYSILGSVVQELAGENADVIISIPNGLDLHEWEPSARDIENINRAALVVRNGIGLEAGMERYLKAAEEGGVKIFTASDHIPVRKVEPHEDGHEAGDGHHRHEGASDPHFWTDPVMIKAVVEALVPVLKNKLGIDAAERAHDIANRLDDLDKQVAYAISSIPPEERMIVTGHESMGYFAQRYGFKLIGVIVPGLSSQASVSASDMSSLKKAILDNRVKAIFTELGTSPSVARAISSETGAMVVELNTHALPADGSYFTFVKKMADTIANGLRQGSRRQE